MSRETILECAIIAQTLSIPTLSLSGGEPTLRDDLAEVINSIGNICTNTNINLTKPLQGKQ